MPAAIPRIEAKSDGVAGVEQTMASIRQRLVDCHTVASRTDPDLGKSPSVTLQLVVTPAGAVKSGDAQPLDVLGYCVLDHTKRLHFAAPMQDTKVTVEIAFGLDD